MEHNAPHPNAEFEGYYNKFALPSGAHVVIVICTVRRAKIRPHALTFVYVPKDGSSIYHRDIFPDAMEMKRLEDHGHAFILEMPEIGHVKWDHDSITEYELEHEAFSFRARTSSRVPWSDITDTPEGMLVRLPLPLHWHVHSLKSQSEYTLKLPNHDLPDEDSSGSATVHQEKNWAFSFPSAHMWIQARRGDRGFCCAGGQILGMEAFLLGYRSQDINFDFRPPFATRIAGISPFMSYKPDWETRSFGLSIQSFRRKITMKAVAPKGTFFPLTPPFPEGHRENYLNQSFRAKIEVKIYESGWLSPWQLVREDTFEDGSLEFGAGYYPNAGTEMKFN